MTRDLRSLEPLDPEAVHAEPKLPARLLDGAAATERAVFQSCNNCTVPQVTGAPGICRTPAVIDEVGALRKRDEYGGGRE